MPFPRRSAFAVRFDDVLFDEDLAHASAPGHRIALAAREQLEREGAPFSLLARCRDDHRDGTNLAGAVKLYLPMPYVPGGSY